MTCIIFNHCEKGGNIGTSGVTSVVIHTGCSMDVGSLLFVCNLVGGKMSALPSTCTSL